MTIEDIISLSAAERLALIERIWDSLTDDDVSLPPAQRAELDDSIATFDQERLRGTTWDALEAELAALTPSSARANSTALFYPQRLASGLQTSWAEALG